MASGETMGLLVAAKARVKCTVRFFRTTPSSHAFPRFELYLTISVTLWNKQSTVMTSTLSTCSDWSAVWRLGRSQGLNFSFPSYHLLHNYISLFSCKQLSSTVWKSVEPQRLNSFMCCSFTTNTFDFWRGCKKHLADHEYIHPGSTEALTSVTV